MRGRKTIPTAIKELKGTLEKSRVLENEMKVSVINEIPEPSEDLNEEGRKIWENVCYELKRNGILSTVDLDLVESYCQEMAMYKHATRQLKNKGAVYKSQSGYPMINPWQTIRNQALKSATNIGQLFGITPSARARIPQQQQPASKLEILKKKII
jgi:P27 family predicted phage terminase small subunit